jgi:HPt (histidine-containing phosphotransfer) domain-containing protein
MDALRAAEASGDPQALRRAVHTLRGTAANYGCARLEAAAAGAADGAGLGAVERACAATLEALTRP